MILFKFFILGILTALLFPPFFMLPLGLIIFPFLIKLLFKISKKSLITFFLYGYIYGLGFCLIFLCWIHNPFLIYESTKPYAILAILFPCFLSLVYGICFCLFKYIRGYFLIFTLTPFVFLLIEFVISNIFYGFPWVSYSLILSNNYLGFYILKYFGIYVSSYLIIFFYSLPIYFFYIHKFSKTKISIIILYLPFALSLSYFYIFSESNNNKFNKELSLDIYQIVSPIKNFNRKKIETNIRNYIKNSNSEIIIFAENNYPYIISDNNITNLTEHIKNNKMVIIGATREENNKFYNSFVFLEEGNVQYFDKKILVPFGEFLPFRRYFKFMEKITGNLDFESGNINRFIKSKDNLNILPIICYEIIFNEIFRKNKKNEIDLLVNITNDSWFGNNVGPYQHFYLTRIRALTYNIPLVRVSNNGISAVIDRDGKILKYSKLNQKSNFKHKLKIFKQVSYKSVHNFFSIYLIFLLIIFIILNNYKSHYEK